MRQDVSIEQRIDDLIDALDRNTAALGAKLPGEAPAKAKPAAAAKKPAKTEEQLVAEIVAKNAATEIAKDDGPTLEDVKAAINKMLKANKRNAAIALLASFDGATNAPTLQAQGSDVMSAFITKAEDILLDA